MKKLWTAVLAAMMLLMMSAGAMAADSRYWHEVVTAKPAGYEVIGNYVMITSAEGMAWLGKQSIAGESFEGKKVLLKANIDLSAHLWQPTAELKGEFDGRGHVISGLTIKSVHDDGSNQFAGLFSKAADVKNLILDAPKVTIAKKYDRQVFVGTVAGQIAQSGYSKGWLTVRNPQISVDVDWTSSGNGYAMVKVGGVVGASYASLEKCSTIGGSVTVDCSKVAVFVGGVVGQCSSVSECVNSAQVTAKSSMENCYAGGVVGNNSTVYNSGNRAAVYGSGAEKIHVGGVAGWGSCRGSYNTGDIKGKGSDYHYYYGSVGGTVVTAIGGVAGTGMYTENCYSTGRVEMESSTTPIKGAGGVIGCARSSILNCLTSQSKIYGVKSSGVSGDVDTSGSQTNVTNKTTYLNQLNANASSGFSEPWIAAGADTINKGYPVHNFALRYELGDLQWMNASEQPKGFGEKTKTTLPTKDAFYQYTSINGDYFEGWYDNADFAGTAYTQYGGMTDGAKTLYAKVKPYLKITGYSSKFVRDLGKSNCRLYVNAICSADEYVQYAWYQGSTAQGEVLSTGSSYTTPDTLPVGKHLYTVVVTGPEKLMEYRTCTVQVVEQALTVNAPVFEAANPGYAQPEAKRIVIGNNTDSYLYFRSVQLTGEQADCFALTVPTGSKTLAPNGTYENCTIQPAAGLAEGEYTAIITVTDDQGNTAQGSVRFVVEPEARAVQIIGGTATAGVTDGKAKAGESVSVKANAPEAGKKFAGWTAQGVTLSDEQKAAQEMTFTMPENDVTLTAQYAWEHEHGGVAYLPWDGSELTLGMGNYAYYLNQAGSTMLEKTIVVPAGTTLDLCLNGKILGQYQESGTFVVNGTLRLHNCGSASSSAVQDHGGVLLTVNAGGVFELYDEVNLGGYSANSTVVNRGTLSMLGGSWQSISAQNKSCMTVIDNYGTIVMKNGNINRTGESPEGSITVNNRAGASLTMNNGRIDASDTAIRSEGELIINGGSVEYADTDVAFLGGTMHLGANYRISINKLYIADGLKVSADSGMAFNSSIRVTHEKQADSTSPIDFLTAESVTDSLISKFSSGVKGYAIRVKPGDSKTAQLYRAFTITYDLAGGALPEGAENPTSYQDTDESFTLINPVREGFTFAGWTGTQITAPIVNLTIGKGSTGDLAFTATWTAKTFEISAKAEGPGRVEGAGVYGYGDTVTLTAVPDAGAAFVGWSEDMASAQGGESPVLSFVATQNRELIAKFRYLNLPVFTKHPQSVTVREGESAVFSAEAECEAPMVICWEADRGDRRGFVSVGCGNSAYTLPAAKLSDSGMRIRCVATAADGTVVSKVAVLTVVPATPINPDDLPKTGDTQNLALWCALATIAAIAAYALKRKEV